MDLEAASVGGASGFLAWLVNTLQINKRLDSTVTKELCEHRHKEIDRRLEQLETNQKETLAVTHRTHATVIRLEAKLDWFVNVCAPPSWRGTGKYPKKP